MAEQIIKVQDHFWRFEEDGVRSFLFEGETRAMLVDTGFGTLPLKKMVTELTDKPVFVVNTHTDGDHTGCNRDFDAIYMHPAEMDYYVRKNPEVYRRESLHAIWEGDIIDLGYWKFEVLLTPGHTPGSIMFLDREKRMLISGDTIQDGNIFMFSDGRNLPAFIATMERMVKMSGEFDTVWPSHSTCPITPAIIPGLLAGAKDLEAGKLTPQEPPWEIPCKLYRCDVAAFCY